MSKSNLPEEQKIIQYITDNPLSFTRNIVDNYSKKRANYTSTEKILQNLKKTKKIASIGDNHPAYYVMPNKNNFAKTISEILQSKNIVKARFQKLTYENPKSDWSVEQIVSNLICLFHLHWKIHTLEKKSRKNRPKLDSKQFQKKFSKNYHFVAKDFSFDDFRSAYTYVISESYPMAKMKLVSLSTHKFPLKKIHSLMKEYMKTKSMRSVADKHGTTTKNVRKLLDRLLDNKGEYSWQKSSYLKQIDSGSIFVSFDPDIFRLMINSKADDDALLGYLFSTEQGLYEDDSDKIWLNILKKTART
ncbi:MAG: hypothetical protein ACW9W3_05855 [Candidatus Nitrosopumilus sp. bin_68KS]